MKGIAAGLAVVGVLLCLGVCARATNLASVQFTCPVCGTKFSSEVVASVSYGGATDEGRPITLGADIQEARLHTCTRCRYTAFAWSLVGGSDVPDAGQIGAIRAALSGRADLVKAKELTWSQKVELCILCYRARKPTPFGLVEACIVGAWLADDHGTPQQAAAHRQQALRAAKAFLAETKTDDAYKLAWVRFLAGAVCARQGRYDQALRFFDEFFKPLKGAFDKIDRQKEQIRKEIDCLERLPPDKRQDDHARQIDRLNEKLYGLEESCDALGGLSNLAFRQWGRAKQKRLGEAKAREAFAKATPRDKRFFLESFGGSTDARTTAVVVRALKDRDEQVRLLAAETLAKRSPVPAEAIGPLIAAMADPWDQVRRAAIETLSDLPSPSARVRQALLGGMNSKHPDVRAACLAALGGLGTIGPDVVVVAIARMKDRVPRVRAAAARALGVLRLETPQTIAALVAGLTDSSYEVRNACIGALGKIGPAAVPALCRQLRHTDQDERRYATYAIREIGPAAGAATEDLLRLMRSKDPNDWEGAMEALAAMGTTDARFLSALADKIRHTDEYYARGALRAAKALGPRARAVTQAVVASLRRGEPRTREQAIETIRAIRPDGNTVVGPLIEALSDASVQSAAMGALGDLGPAASSAAPHLVKRLETGTDWDRAAAAEALGRIGAPAAGSAVGPLTAALKDPAAGVRREAARALGRMGPAARSAALALGNLLADDNVLVTAAAAEALGHIGSATDRALRGLEKAARGGSREVRIPAAASLVQLGRRAEGAALLIRVLRDPQEHSDVRGRAALGLAELGLRDQTALAALRSAAEGDESYVAVPAALALARLGHPREALPALRRALAEESFGYCTIRDVLDALAHLGSAAAPAAGELIQATQRVSGDIRPQDVVNVLVRIGPAAAGALQAAGKHKDWRVRYWAAVARKRIEGKE